MMRKKSTHIIRQLTFFLIILSGVYVVQMAVADNHVSPDKQLASRIDYWFVGHLEQTDSAGRLLVWEATVAGDLQGKMKWWFVTPPPVSAIPYSGGQATFYSARWELWVDDELVMAGESSGKTQFSDDGDGMWDGHGRVTEASGSFKSLEGRAVYETGPVVLGDDPPKTFSGSGLFVIY